MIRGKGSREYEQYHYVLRTTRIAAKVQQFKQKGFFDIAKLIFRILISLYILQNYLCVKVKNWLHCQVICCGDHKCARRPKKNLYSVRLTH